jgi:pyridoxine 5'-phosphate synthase PdxJ
MLTQVIKELVTLPVELFVQNEEVKAKLEQSLATAVDTVGFFTGDFSSIFSKTAEGATEDGKEAPVEAQTPSPDELTPAHLLPWI